MNGNIHASVLLHEAVRGMAPKDGGKYIDATCGLGGHAEAILEACGPTGRLLAVDRDPTAIQIAAGRLKRFGERVSIVEGDFSELRLYAEAAGLFPADGIVADLGVSSMQLDDPKRGFSFSKDGPLDMRMGPRVGETAAEMLESFDVEQLKDILRNFGEVNRCRPMAEAIIAARDRGELKTTGALAEVIERASGGRKSSPIHPATRAFQAIRIAVNRELEELETFLNVLPELIRAGGRAAIISFHSLEDRMVKHAFEDPKETPLPRGLPSPTGPKLGPWRQLTKKPLTPSDAELALNPRARSAKLRIAERREDGAKKDETR
jgi:16S rRNA (cytosine1402-N4)-methyltransferase